MRTVLIVIALGVAVTAIPSRIVGGEKVTIDEYPALGGLLFYSSFISFFHMCSVNILTNRALLTAAHCIMDEPLSMYRIRVGSSFASSGGTIYTVGNIIVHPSFNAQLNDNDIAMIHTEEHIVFSAVVQTAPIPGTNYIVADNQSIWTAGWGAVAEASYLAEQLKHVQTWTVNQEICAENYSGVGMTVTDNMMCSGWLGVGGRDQCLGDSGSPLYHSNVIIGIYSWGHGCARPDYPGVNTRLNRYTAWIQANA